MNEIINKYIRLFPNINDKTKSLMSFGFECDVGWYSIIESMLKEISECEIPNNFEIVQIKEKLGELRIYTDNSNEYINSIINKAIIKAETTCELCGNFNAKLCGGNWFRTLCDECNNGD